MEQTCMTSNVATSGGDSRLFKRFDRSIDQSHNPKSRQYKLFLLLLQVYCSFADNNWTDATTNIACCHF